MYSSSSESSTFLLLFAKKFSKIFKHFMKKEFNGDEKCAFLITLEAIHWLNTFFNCKTNDYFCAEMTRNILYGRHNWAKVEKEKTLRIFENSINEIWDKATYTTRPLYRAHPVTVVTAWVQQMTRHQKKEKKNWPIRDECSQAHEKTSQSEMSTSGKSLSRRKKNYLIGFRRSRGNEEKENDIASLIKSFAHSLIETETKIKSDTTKHSR